MLLDSHNLVTADHILPRFLLAWRSHPGSTMESLGGNLRNCLVQTAPRHHPSEPLGHRCHYFVLVLNSLGNCKTQPRSRVTLGTCWPHAGAFVCPGTSLGQGSTNEPLKPSQQFSWSPTSISCWNVGSTLVSLLVHGRKGASGPNLASTPKPLMSCLRGHSQLLLTNK